MFSNGALLAVIVVCILIVGIAISFLLKASPKPQKNICRTANPWGKTPYAAQKSFLSEAEKVLFFTLREMVGDLVEICPKPAVREILCVTSQAGNERQMYFNWISQKHVDFVLCHRDTMDVICAVELDDSSHQRKDRIHRDAFMDKAFDTAEVELIHIPWRPYYSREDLAEILYILDQPIGISSRRAPPLCPRCGAEMVLRIAGKGSYEGKQFYGCPHYPKCNGVRRVSK